MENLTKQRIIYKVNQEILKEILADRSIPTGAKLTLLYLIYRLGGKNYTFPSQNRIGKDLGFGDRQVRNHLNVLRKKEIIF